MSESTLITIPWTALASSNQRNQRRGGRAHSWGYKASLERIRLLAMGQVTGERPRYPEDRLRMLAVFYPPDRRKRDVMNYMKGLMDALQGVMYADDYQVTIVEVERDEPHASNPRVTVVVRPW